MPADRSPLADLDPAADFEGRHIGPRATDLAAMLAELGFGSLDELTDTAVPAPIRIREPLALPGPVSEPEVLDRLRALAAENEVFT